MHPVLIRMACNGLVIYVLSFIQFTINFIYKKILQLDWFSAHLFVA